MLWMEVRNENGRCRRMKGSSSSFDSSSSRSSCANICQPCPEPYHPMYAVDLTCCQYFRLYRTIPTLASLLAMVLGSSETKATCGCAFIHDSIGTDSRCVRCLVCLVWCGAVCLVCLVWCGPLCGVVYSGVPCVWCGVVRCAVCSFGVVWCGAVWCGPVFGVFGVVCAVCV